MSRYLALDNEQQRVLKMCRKKRRLTCRDADWDILASLVHKSVLDRVLTDEGKNAGWSYYKVSRRGKKYLDDKIKVLTSPSK